MDNTEVKKLFNDILHSGLSKSVNTVYPWCQGHKIDPAPEHCAFAIAAINGIADILGLKHDSPSSSVNFLRIVTLNGKLKIYLEVKEGAGLYADGGVRSALLDWISDIEERSLSAEGQGGTNIPFADLAVSITDSSPQVKQIDWHEGRPIFLSETPSTCPVCGREEKFKISVCHQCATGFNKEEFHGEIICDCGYRLSAIYLPPENEQRQDSELKAKDTCLDVWLKRRQIPDVDIVHYDPYCLHCGNDQNLQCHILITHPSPGLDIETPYFQCHQCNTRAYFANTDNPRTKWLKRSISDWEKAMVRYADHNKRERRLTASAAVEAESLVPSFPTESSTTCPVCGIEKNFDSFVYLRPEPHDKGQPYSYEFQGTISCDCGYELRAVSPIAKEDEPQDDALLKAANTSFAIWQKRQDLPELLPAEPFCLHCGNNQNLRHLQFVTSSAAVTEEGLHALFCPQCNAYACFGESKYLLEDGLSKSALALWQEAYKPENISLCRRVFIPQRANQNDLQPTSEEDNSHPGPSIEILPPASCDALEQLVKGSDNETAKRLQALQARIKTLQVRKNTRRPDGLRKALAVVTGAQTLDCLRTDRFPNFHDFFEYLRAQFSLAMVGDSVFRLPPILLVGEPGVGKTEVLSRLAGILNTAFLIHNMAAAQSGSTLTGSDIFWHNTRQGTLFDLLVFGHTANPVVLLDELDKAPPGHYYSPIGALYSLLERPSAARFTDLSLPGVTIDASHVVWFAAANDSQAIDPAILSRFRVFQIPVPTKEQMPQIIKSIYSDLLERETWGKEFNPELPPGVLNILTGITPRQMRQILETACAKAATDGRREILPTDICIEIKSQTMGF